MKTTQPPTKTNLDISQRRIIFGRIVDNKNKPLYLVKVINTSNPSQAPVYTNSNGEFNILGSLTDIINISSSGFKEKDTRLKLNDIYTLEKSDTFTIVSILGSIYFIVLIVFTIWGAELINKKKGNKGALIAMIVLSWVGLGLNPVFLVVLIILCIVYSIEGHKKNNSQNNMQMRQNSSQKVRNKNFSHAYSVNPSAPPLTQRRQNNSKKSNTYPVTGQDTNIPHAYPVRRQDTNIPQALKVRRQNNQQGPPFP